LSKATDVPIVDITYVSVPSNSTMQPVVEYLADLDAMMILITAAFALPAIPKRTGPGNRNSNEAS
jgi:hypothetical protein